MTAPIGMADFAATVTRPAFFPAATHPNPPIPTGPWAPSTDSDFPHAVDPALADQPPLAALKPCCGEVLLGEYCDCAEMLAQLEQANRQPIFFPFNAPKAA